MIRSVDYKGIFEQLFRENYIRLCYHAYSFLNDEEAAKDAVNDVFEKVWVNFEKIERTQSVLPLLYTLVRNHCVSLLRHKKVRERFNQELRLKDEATDEGYMEYELLIERLRQSVEKLPGQTKVVFRMCFLDGKKYQETADALAISINTVKTHINKALRILREEYSDYSLLLVILSSKK
ncbi:MULTISPECIES: RNA polymerase sigma-70 factor [Butyricimonas]|jgi:RNA polymerase sigma-70 factor|uniref:RNA polymerase sigma-70 factor n=1 Tax=Butyricimonas hominis TaxID=2763032 RepID=A0ABR7CZQ4_9BACT|nr:MULTISPECIES: RNA polymerase sigma-70 factor [Butyricimonas]MBC5621148.1 RNA polymerase sigma-70 factor [Butyricimonas hominis]MCB6972036.1 RNA polymerase sigma-70 factor [Butyricimonas synergistica]MCG4519044.1 RNA polymerase sigma-70 factor [Butyricimonas sp. DFI.6.44]